MPLSASHSIGIVGGGAAGFFAAITAKEICPSAKVVIYEKGTHPLTKVKITGGGRCNLTNSFATISDLRQAYPRGHQLLKRLFRTFNHEDTIRWFEQRHVPLIVQEDQCVFPRSQKSQNVIDALTLTAARLGVALCTSSRVSQIEKETSEENPPFFRLSFANQPTTVLHQAVIVTTGGEPKSQGWEWLQALGNEIIPPLPSLFTFTISSKDFRSLMGTVLPEAIVSLSGTKFTAKGALLITHWGISGPAVLKLSAYAARYLGERAYTAPLSIAWTGETNAHIVGEALEKLASSSKKQVNTIAPYHLPHRLWEYLLERAGIAVERRWSEVGRKGRNRLIELLTNDTYTIEGRSTYKEEFVTAGGIALTSIHSNTLESKSCEGLFFAGEVLDVDGITGGFNLQAAWTTGYVAGKSAAAYLSSRSHKILCERDTD